jgi:hypothetical protein
MMSQSRSRLTKTGKRSKKKNRDNNPYGRIRSQRNSKPAKTNCLNRKGN